jgi:hypothetical protein
MKRFLALLLLASCSKPAPDPQPSRPIELKPTVVAAASASVEKPRPQHILAKYSTKYNKQEEQRSWNIELDAKKLDGAILQPGKEFSFNERVGPRDETAGFKPAPVIFLGEMTKDYGGGTCQTSSTMYAAALYAGLDIVKRRGHSRPSHYIGRGLDATVAYPDVDLVVTNPYALPITLHTKTEDGVLTEWFEGDESIEPPTVKATWLGGQVIDYERRYRKTNKYRNDHRHLKQHGEPGQDGVLLVQYSRGDKHWSKRITANYKPVDEVWEVGLAWDMDQKPWEPTQDQAQQ